MTLQLISTVFSIRREVRRNKKRACFCRDFPAETIYLDGVVRWCHSIYRSPDGDNIWDGYQRQWGNTRGIHGKVNAINILSARQQWRCCCWPVNYRRVSRIKLRLCHCCLCWVRYWMLCFPAGWVWTMSPVKCQPWMDLNARETPLHHPGCH